MKHVKRIVAVAVAASAITLGLVAPASAGGRYRDHNNVSTNGCYSSYTQDSYQGRQNSFYNSSNSNERYCV